MYSPVRIELPAAFTFRFLTAWQSCFLPQPPWSFPLFRSKTEKFLTLAVLFYEACRVAQFLNSNISEDDALCSYGTTTWNSPSLLSHPLVLRGLRACPQGRTDCLWPGSPCGSGLCLLHFQAAGLTLLSLLTRTRPVYQRQWTSFMYTVDFSSSPFPCSSLEQNLPPSHTHMELALEIFECKFRGSFQFM